MTDTAVLDRVTKAQEWTLEQIKASQERLVALNRRMAAMVHRLPTVHIPFADRLPSDRLPDRKALVEHYFDFVERTTEANREFTEAVLDVWTAPDGQPAAPRKAAAKRAHKPAAKAGETAAS